MGDPSHISLIEDQQLEQHRMAQHLQDMPYATDSLMLIEPPPDSMTLAAFANRP